MNHLVEEQLNEYLDYALDESARADVELHLQTCADCRVKLDKLEAIPEAHLEHNLVPAILARLPRRKPIVTWTRTFAAQVGVAIGFIFWLGMQVAPLVRMPQLTLPKLPTLDFQILAARLTSFRFSLPEFQFPDISYQIPTLNYQLPTLSTQLPADYIALLGISTVLLWVVGNIILLKSRREAEA